jgi:signal transduction histidine kinase
MAPDHPLSVTVEPLLVDVDVVKAERIVVNLVANAVRHTPTGTPISVRAGRHEDGVVITVEDGGPGVPEELRSAIFEPFRQGAATTPHSPGVGIGLALVQRFAELHGGRAWVDGAPGGGAAFHVSLRCTVRAAADAADGPDERRALRGSKGAARGATKAPGDRRGSRVPG